MTLKGKELVASSMKKQVKRLPEGSTPKLNLKPVASYTDNEQPTVQKFDKFMISLNQMPEEERKKYFEKFDQLVDEV